MPKKIYLLAGIFSVFILTGVSCIQLGGSAQGPVGVFRSDDGIETWKPKNILPTSQGIKSIAGVKSYRFFTDPSDKNALYLGSRGQGLYFTYNNGETWQATDALTGKFIYALTVDPKDKCNIYASDGRHVFKTTDCMRTWNLMFTEERPTQRFTSLAIDYGDSKTIYGALAGGDVYRSRDGGLSWRIINRFNFELRDLLADPQNPKRLYLASYRNGLFRSDDSGDTWQYLNAGFKDFSDSLSFNRMALNPAQKDSLFWVSKYGILRSNDAGATWTDLKLLTPPGSVNIYGFAMNPNNQKELYYTGSILNEKNQNVRSTLYKSVDGGVNWVTKKLPTNTIPVGILINSEKDNVVSMGFSISAADIVQ